MAIFSANIDTEIPLVFISFQIINPICTLIIVGILQFKLPKCKPISEKILLMITSLIIIFIGIGNSGCFFWKLQNVFNILTDIWLL